MSKVSIRPATEHDAPALIRCVTAAYAPFVVAIPDLPDVSQGVAEDIADHHVWVATANRTIVGGLILHITGTEAHLVNLAVDPDFSGMGIGRALITTVEDFSRAKGCVTLVLATHTLMPQNVRLYERLGWQISEMRGPKVCMIKSL